ncbi:hypothetical protein SO694_00112034 [Aureococcus anophagefferens]|uniref:Uncharacterized protein n=1 Tax=Aureococcus anophagefferens TaxID=44056 RepID=A0ABR1FWZ2_AURAN
MVFTAELAAMALFGAGFGVAAWAIDRRALSGMYCAGSRVETSLCRGASVLLVAAAARVAAALPLADFELFAHGPARLVSGAVPVVPFARDGAQGHAAAWVGVACAAFLTHRFATAVATRSMVDGALRPSAVAFLACGLAGLAVSSLLARAAPPRASSSSATSSRRSRPSGRARRRPRPSRRSRASRSPVRRSSRPRSLRAALLGLPGARDSDAAPNHGGGAVHLQFCEEPYAYSSLAAQACSLACHLPYVPALAAASPRFRALLCGRDVPEILGAARPCVGLLVALAAWTAFGHYVPDPRAYCVAEVSIALALSWFAFTFRATTPALRRAPTPAFAAGAAALLALGAFAFACFGLVTLIFANALLPLAAYKFGLGALVPLATRARLAGLMVLAVATIVAEATFCDALVRVKPLPYHAAFDLLFFQVLATAALRATLVAADKDA